MGRKEPGEKWTREEDDRRTVRPVMRKTRRKGGGIFKSKIGS